LLGDAQGRQLRVTNVHRFKPAGFTLIELLIALAIFTILALLAVPMYGEMIANTEVRNAAQSILSGLRSAQAEAVRTNTPAKFVLSTDGWQVFLTNTDGTDFDTTAYRTYKFTEGASRATTTPSSANVTFNGFGQIANLTDADPVTQIDVTTSAISNPRSLRVIVSSSTTTSLKLCDPNSSDAALACPAT
jgi:type IV fimbrial biogenesis protein FimT